MPRTVDHRERRELIAAGLLRLAAAGGLEGISLRHVAAECGVTSGMVQHYFPTKDAMMTFAMESATTRYTARITTMIEQLGDQPAARNLVRAVLRTLLPTDASERDDARVALAFLSYASTRPTVADQLGAGNADLRVFLAAQIRQAQGAGGVVRDIDPLVAATALLGAAEGLGVQSVSSGLSPVDALAALDAQLALVFGPS